MGQKDFEILRKWLARERDGRWQRLAYENEKRRVE
jgi:hypothetical protein